MINKKCNCCGKNNLKTGNLKSSLINSNFNYCLICGAMRAEPKFLIEETREQIENKTLFIDDDVPLIYYNKNSDSYVDIRTGAVPFKFKDGTILHKRNDVLKRLKKNDKNTYLG